MSIAVAVVGSACGRLGFGAGGSDGLVSLGDVAVTHPICTPTGQPASTIGLAAYYAMEDLVQIYPPTYHQTSDSSGSGRNVVCELGACPSAVAGRYGHAFLFSPGHHFYDSASPSLPSLSAFTIAAFVLLPAALDSRACIATGGAQTGGDAWAACIVAPGAVAFEAPAGVGPSGGDVPTGAWHHVAIRWDGVTRSIGIDGVEVASSGDAIAFDGARLTIAADYESFAYAAPFLGAIDELRIYSRALTSGEICDLAQ